MIKLSITKTHIRYAISILIQFAVTLLILGTVWITSSELSPGETSKQWLWLGQTAVVFAVGTWFSVLIYPGKMNDKFSSTFYYVIIWSFILWGGLEAVKGLSQIYGFSRSNHSLFALTGTFFNPGPYSGYLAMIFPLCLNEYFELKKIKKTSIPATIGYYASLLVMLLIVCVLPAGMSRSAWIAAIVSGVFVLWHQYNGLSWIRNQWNKNRKRFIAITVLAVLLAVIGLTAIFYLKKDSANGRLFMWKISTYAIAEKPIAGHGYGSFAAAYGEAQEAYFSAGNYSPQEEHVAGNPEYAFNEYLHVVIEWGIPGIILILGIVFYCLRKGVKNHHLSACAGMVSLGIFAFSSYPMQLPAFIISFVFLLFACVLSRRKLLPLIFSILIGVWGAYLWTTSDYAECKKWMQARMLYKLNAYERSKTEYEELYPVLKNRSEFLFEYGHALHKLEETEKSNTILKQAAQLNCDPMILNIIGKNYQIEGNYAEAERWLLRSVDRLPGRIYPYYLLAKLYAEPDFYQREKLKKMVNVVLYKDPKVQSTAIKEMREEVKQLLQLTQ